jgi:hypothetical protein
MIGLPVHCWTPSLSSGCGDANAAHRLLPLGDCLSLSGSLGELTPTNAAGGAQRSEP